MRALERDYSRGEIIHAYVWLSVFAAIFALVCATYLWQPLSWALAPLGVCVLTRTAALWTQHRTLWLIPLAVWCAVWVGFGGGWALIAGLAGGAWGLATSHTREVPY